MIPSRDWHSTAGEFAAAQEQATPRQRFACYACVYEGNDEVPDVIVLQAGTSTCIDHSRRSHLL